MSTKAKVAIAFFFVANIIFLVTMRNRRANSPKFADPVRPHEWTVTLSERTAEEREYVLSAAFPLSDFDVKPLEGVREVVIPRPRKWFEEWVISTSYVSFRVDGREGKQSSGNDSKLPRQGEPVDVALRSVTLVAFESAPAPKSNQVIVKEKRISRDTCFTKDGTEVPVSELFTVGRYFVDDNDNTLLTTQSAVQMNGQAHMRFRAEVPLWLVPARKLAVGESWVQLGAHPVGISNTAPLPEATRKLSRFVVFEGRRAAEIETTSTLYDFVPGPIVSHVQRQEQTLSYLDLETGEPLWFESIDHDEQSVVRGCNQIFVKHLIRTKPKD